MIRIANAANRSNETTRSAGKCGQICGDRLPKLRPSKADFDGYVTDWYYTTFQWIKAQDDCRAARLEEYPKSQSSREQKNAAASICLGAMKICRTTKKSPERSLGAALPFEPNPSPKYQTSCAEKMPSRERHIKRGNSR
jgi:hypothetical protein